MVDTGSQDHTPRLAQQAGAAVYVRPWDDDFSAARNYGLDRVSARWVLYIDADERLSVDDPNLLRSTLETAATTVAFRVEFFATVDATPYREMRLWRHRPDIRFAGRMHEGVVIAIDEIADREGLDIGVAPLAIRHLGYDGDVTWKHHRNIPLLRAQLEADPERVYLWDELGRAEAGLGNTEAALAAWAQGIAIVRANGPTKDGDASVFGRSVQTLREQGDLATAGRLLAEVRALVPTYRMGWWLEAKLAADEGRWQDALAPLDALLGQDPSAVGVDGIGYDRRMFGQHAWNERALCLFHLGRFAESADAFEQAARAAGESPESFEFRVKAVAARAKAAG